MCDPAENQNPTSVWSGNGRPDRSATTGFGRHPNLARKPQIKAVHGTIQLEFAVSLEMLRLPRGLVAVIRGSGTDHRQTEWSLIV